MEEKIKERYALQEYNDSLEKSRGYQIMYNIVLQRMEELLRKELENINHGTYASEEHREAMKKALKPS